MESVFYVCVCACVLLLCLHIDSLSVNVFVSHTHTQIIKYRDADCCVCVGCSDSASALRSNMAPQQKTVKQDEGKKKSIINHSWDFRNIYLKIKSEEWLLYVRAVRISFCENSVVAGC